eukprot:UN05019
MIFLKMNQRGILRNYAHVCLFSRIHEFLKQTFNW